MVEITTLGLDLAKNVFQIHGIDVTGRLVRRQLRRSEVIKFFAALPCQSAFKFDPRSASNFCMPNDNSVVRLLGTDLEDVIITSGPDPTETALTEMQAKYRNASPEVKERISKYIERGVVGALVKKKNGYKCQVCEALGRDPLGFKKKTGEH